MPRTPHILTRIAEREARETVQLEALHEALGHLVAARKSARTMYDHKVLQADWHFAKALHDVFGSDCSARELQAACDNLGVGENGDDVEVAA
jgi:hypothetical protein